MRYRVGRFLQLLGLILLPVAMAGNLARQDRVDEKVMLVLAGLGIAVFILGWLLQRGAAP